MEKRKRSGEGGSARQTKEKQRRPGEEREGETAAPVFNMNEAEEKCIFCRIVNEKCIEFFYEDDDFICFKDKAPVASHHFLIVPKKHIKNIKSLKYSDVDLVKKMLRLGEEVLQNQNANLEDARFGYHRPPFNSVQHLHMHAISPISELNLINQIIFRPNSCWFKTTSEVIEDLEEESEPECVIS